MPTTAANNSKTCSHLIKPTYNKYEDQRVLVLQMKFRTTHYVTYIIITLLLCLATPQLKETYIFLLRCKKFYDLFQKKNNKNKKKDEVTMTTWKLK